jgi:hypothetical protein
MLRSVGALRKIERFVDYSEIVTIFECEKKKIAWVGNGS